MLGQLVVRGVACMLMQVDAADTVLQQDTSEGGGLFAVLHNNAHDNQPEVNHIRHSKEMY